MENEWIDWLRASAPRQSPRRSVVQGIGDDCAVINSTPDRPMLCCADMILDGVHFDSQTTPFELIGRKAIAVNLSDVAAMGAIPMAAIVSVAFPQSQPDFDPKRLFAGMFEIASRFGVEIVGGDTTSWPQALAVNVTMLATSGKEIWRRDGAQPHDRILVSGELGGSSLGHHLTFEPRIDLAQHINERYEISGAIDLSDGIGMDLRRLCQASQCGAIIDEQHMPISRQAHACASSSSRTALDHALGDGEDFELLLTMAPAVAAKLLADPVLADDLTDVGVVTAEGEYRIRATDGSCRELSLVGYEHRFVLPDSPVGESDAPVVDAKPPVPKSP